MKHTENILQYIEPEIRAALYKDYLEYLDGELDNEIMTFREFAIKNVVKYT